MHDDEDLVRARLAELQAEHRSLDELIERYGSEGNVDELSLRRLKKRKLRLKDQISQIEDYLIPDIIA